MKSATIRKQLGQFGLMATAVGVLFGHSASIFFSSLIDGSIMPLFDLLLEEGSWNGDTIEIGSYSLKWGDMLADFIQFVVVGFISIKAIQWLHEEDENK